MKTFEFKKLFFLFLWALISCQSLAPDVYSSEVPCAFLKGDANFRKWKIRELERKLEGAKRHLPEIDPEIAIETKEIWKLNESFVVKEAELIALSSGAKKAADVIALLYAAIQSLIELLKEGIKQGSDKILEEVAKKKDELKAKILEKLLITKQIVEITVEIKKIRAERADKKHKIEQLKGDKNSLNEDIKSYSERIQNLHQEILQLEAEYEKCVVTECRRAGLHVSGPMAMRLKCVGCPVPDCPSPVVSYTIKPALGSACTYKMFGVKPEFRFETNRLSVFDPLIQSEPTGKPIPLFSGGEQFSAVSYQACCGTYTFQVTKTESGEATTVPFTFTNTSAKPPVTIPVISKVPVVLSKEGGGADCADENESVSTLPPPPVPEPQGQPVFAVLDLPFAGHVQELFFAFGEGVALVDPQTASLSSLSPYAGLLIPSESLQGFENSDAFKALLSGYVEQGGVLISFALQRGYEFTALPGSPSGYGFREDQSCYMAGSFLDQFHPILTSQTDATFDGGIDGFFVEWPKEAKVLLRRVKNNLPAALVYPIGSGFVVATTLYTDYAFGTGQLTQDEITFMKDLIAWAKNPKQEYPQSKPGETVSIPVSVTNATPLDVGSVKFDVKDDKGNVVFTDTVPLSVPAGQTVPYTLTFQAPSALGIYSVFYQLIADSQPFPATFADNISVTPGIQHATPAKDLTFTLLSPGNFFLKGSSVTFTLLMSNSGVEDRTVEVTMRSHAGLNAPLGRFLLSAGTTRTVPFATDQIYHSTLNGFHWDIWVEVFDPERNQVLVGVDQVGFSGQVGEPSVSLSAAFPKRFFTAGETATASLSLTNLTPTAYDGTLQVQAFSPKNEKLFEEFLSISLSASGTSTQSVSIPVPAPAFFGVYPVVVQFLSQGQLIGNATAFFEVPKAQVSISATVPGTFSIGVPARVPFKLTNTGLIEAQGELKVTLNDPDGQELFSETRAVSLTQGEVKTEEFSLTISETKFGTYTLVYTLSTASGDITGQVPIRSEVASTPQLNQNTFTVSDTVQARVFLTNTGQIEQQFNVDTLYLPTNFSHANSITLQPNNSTTLSYTIPLSSAVPAGTQTVGVFFKAKNTLNRPFYFTILSSNFASQLFDLRWNVDKTENILPGVYDIRVKVKDENGTEDTFYPMQDASPASTKLTATWLRQLGTLRTVILKPPQVKETEPEDGEEGVEETTHEVKVFFSKPINKETLTPDTTVIGQEKGINRKIRVTKMDYPQEVQEKTFVATIHVHDLQVKPWKNLKYDMAFGDGIFQS